MNAAHTERRAEPISLAPVAETHALTRHPSFTTQGSKLKISFELFTDIHTTASLLRRICTSQNTTQRGWDDGTLGPHKPK